MYAKDKTAKQTCARNNSFVNTIYNKIKKNNVTLRHMGLDEFDYHNLMSNKNIVSSKEVEEIYDDLNRRYRFMINMKDEYTANLNYVASQLRAVFSETGYSDDMITDMLVYYLYSNDRIYKQVLWFCYGDRIVNNILKNVEIEETKPVKCPDCGEWFEISTGVGRPSVRCRSCQDRRTKKIKLESLRRYRANNRMKNGAKTVDDEEFY